MIFETIAKTGHEEVVFCHNADAGLKAIVAIHNTVLGPALWIATMAFRPASALWQNTTSS